MLCPPACDAQTSTSIRPVPNAELGEGNTNRRGPNQPWNWVQPKAARGLESLGVHVFVLMLRVQGGGSTVHGPASGGWGVELSLGFKVWGFFLVSTSLEWLKVLTARLRVWRFGLLRG